VATIVVHAGMPKTGSTSVQSWLVKHSHELHDEHGVLMLVAASQTPRNPTNEVRLEPYERGRINSGPLIAAWNRADQSPTVARRFIDDLAGFADRCPVILVTAEGLSEPFWRVDQAFLTGFEELAGSHAVRVAYYVRPQHTAIEAGWREAGYKQEHEPAHYVREFSRRFHYFQTIEAVERHAPHIDFVVRPFRTDLLEGGSPVRDFVSRFLSLEAGDADAHANPGLPLELVNVLRHAPVGWFWARGTNQETYPRRHVRKIFEGLEIEESPAIQRSRLILQQYCHETFEHENKELVQRLEWPTDGLVPSATNLDEPWDVAELDDLWAPDASEMERAFFFWALRAALDRMS
jgi:hypothetical protein